MFWTFLGASAAARVGAVVLAISLFPFAFAAREVIRTRELGRDVYPVQARVLQVTPGRKGPVVDVEYQDRHGQTHARTLSLRGGVDEGVKEGGSYTLLVSELDPTRTWSAAAGPPSAFWTLPIWTLGGALFVVGGLLLASSARAARERMRVLARGVPVKGRVVRVEPNPAAAPTARRRRIVYRWEHAGRTYEGTSPPVGSRQDGALVAGRELTVFVDPSRPDLGEVDLYGARSTG